MSLERAEGKINAKDDLTDWKFEFIPRLHTYQSAEGVRFMGLRCLHPTSIQNIDWPLSYVDTGETTKKLG